MTPALLFFMQFLVVAICCLSAGYCLIAAIAMPVDAPCEETLPKPQPVSVLKPLCGSEPRLYENLATFCRLEYPCFQLVFGVSSPHDPAIAIVRQLQVRYPHLDIDLVIDTRVHGSNLKVSNLINMAAHARYEIVVLADSDIAVESDYLQYVTTPLADPAVGVVTCLYHARSIGGFWPRLGALFINEWFAPSVRVAHAGGSRRFGFGATLALRDTTLNEIGGFSALKDCLADDYWLAERARALGLATVLSPVIVTTDVAEPTFTTLWLREIRWLRTIRSVNLAGFMALFITFASPWIIVGALLTRELAVTTGGPVHRALLFGAAIGTIAGIAARILLHARNAPHRLAFWRDLPLVPLRDTLLALQWLAAMFGSQVTWRGVRMAVVNRVSSQRSPSPEA